MADTGKVNIHGKEYSTVAYRVQQFRDEHKDKYSIETEIVSVDADVVVMKATIKDDTGRVIATGHAEEKRSASQINRTSALENCETSAIGRALAGFGLAGTEFASADEVAQAIQQQAKPVAKPVAKSGTVSYDVLNVNETNRPSNGKPISEAQGKLLMARARDFSGLTDWDEIRAWFFSVVGKTPQEVLMSDMDATLKVLEEARVA